MKGSRSLEKRSERPALQRRPRDFNDRRRAWMRRSERITAGVLTVVAHVIVFAALFWPHTVAPSRHVPPPPPSIQVSLVDLRKPMPIAPPKPTMLEPASPDSTVQLPHFVTSAPIMPVATRHAPDNSDLLSDSQLAGAARVGEGGGGGGCNVARDVQQALRRDPLVHAAVEDAHRLGKAIMLWNGDWVRSGEQEGKGLSAVREAIVWELAFTPQACRDERRHGLLLLSLADGSTRFAIGSDDWRWSDLLGLRKIPSDR